MGVYTIYEFYGFVQNIAISGAIVSGVFLLFSTLTLLNCSPAKSERIFCIVNTLLFVACLSCGVYMNYLQVR